MDSSYTAGGLYTVLYSKMAGVMTPETYILAYRTIVVPMGIIVYSTLSIPVLISGLIC